MKTYEELKNIINEYNWDDGFDVPYKVLDEPNCDLALALEIFYLGDGFVLIRNFPHDIDGTKEWLCFIKKLYNDIISGRYKKTNQHYTIPLSKSMRYRLAKNKVNTIFLTDL